MRLVTFSMSASADGYIVGPDGRFDWSVPDPEVFEAHLTDLRSTGVHLLGRRLHETMRYWETVDDATLDEAEREWKSRWNALPKVVFSTSLTEVEGNARLAIDTLPEEIERLRSGPGEGDIAIGGAALAAEAAGLDLIDEYRMMIHPVLVGGGRPYFPQQELQVKLELVEARSFDCGVVLLRHRVNH